MDEEKFSYSEFEEMEDDVSNEFGHHQKPGKAVDDDTESWFRHIYEEDSDPDFSDLTDLIKQ